MRRTGATLGLGASLLAWSGWLKDYPAEKK
jgi:hypothetical protein